ncbi:MAG: helix-turn-helix domain-containing protein [Nanoarchaeota archaeon]
MFNDQALAQRNLLKEVVAASKRQASILLWGHARSGKTTLLKEVLKLGEKEQVSRFVDLTQVHTPPELLSLHIAGLACSWSLSVEGNLDASFLRKHKDSLPEGMQKHADAILNELQKIKPDHRLLLQSAFAMLAQIKGLVLGIDSAERLLELDNFPQVGDIFTYLPREITFILASSDTELKRRLMGFTSFSVSSLSKEETASFLLSLIGQQKKEVVDEIYNISRGDIYTIKAIAKRLVTAKNPRDAYLRELVREDGLLWQRCDAAYRQGLSRARGASLLQSILMLLAQDELKLSELARRLYRSAPVTKSLLERLMKAGLVEKHEKVFAVADPLLRDWLRLREVGA